MTERVWSPEEKRLTAASKEYFEAISAVERSGGDTNEAIMEAMPKEVADGMRIAGVNVNDMALPGGK